MKNDNDTQNMYLEWYALKMISTWECKMIISSSILAHYIRNIVVLKNDK